MATDVSASCETQTWVWCRRCSGESVSIYFRTVESVTDVIDINGSEGEVAASIRAAFKKTAGVTVKEAGAITMASGLVQVGGCAVSDGDPHDDVWKMRGCIQFRVRKKFLKSAIVCLHVFLDDVAVPSRESFQCDAHKCRAQIFGEL